MKKIIHTIYENIPGRVFFRDRIFWPLYGGMQSFSKGKIKKNLKTSLKLIFEQREIGILIKNIKTPIILRPGTSDVPLLYHIFVEEEYNIKPAKEPVFIIDAGANIGFTSLYFANRFPGARIIAIEPEESNFQLLQKNTAAYPNIRCIKAGVWNSTTLLRIKNLEKDSKWAFQVEETTESGPDTCEGISIDGLLLEEKKKEIDIAKIDIEGAEESLFAKNYQWLSKTNLIVIEFHDRIIPGSSKPFWDAVKGMKFKKYKKRKNVVLVRE